MLLQNPKASRYSVFGANYPTGILFSVIQFIFLRYNVRPNLTLPIGKVTAWTC